LLKKRAFIEFVFRENDHQPSLAINLTKSTTSSTPQTDSNPKSSADKKVFDEATDANFSQQIFEIFEKTLEFMFQGISL